MPPASLCRWVYLPGMPPCLLPVCTVLYVYRAVLHLWEKPLRREVSFLQGNLCEERPPFLPKREGILRRRETSFPLGREGIMQNRHLPGIWEEEGYPVYASQYPWWSYYPGVYSPACLPGYTLASRWCAASLLPDRLREAYRAKTSTCRTNS